MSFLSDIKSFQEKALKAAADNTARIVKDAFITPVNYSPSPSNPGPYAKGLLANQWYPSVGNIFSTDISTATNPTGEDSKARIELVITSNIFYGKDAVTSLSNNTQEANYANKLGWKAGDGTNGWVWSGNAVPYFMTAKTESYLVSKYT